MRNASEEEIAELLGDRSDDAIVARVADLGVTLDEVSEALDDLDYEVRFGEPRVAASAKIDEIRSILEELPSADVTSATEPDDDELAGLHIEEHDELSTEA